MSSSSSPRRPPAAIDTTSASAPGSSNAAHRRQGRPSSGSYHVAAAAAAPAPHGEATHAEHTPGSANGRGGRSGPGTPGFSGDNGSGSGNETPSSNPRSARRGPYKCGRCGQPLKGHTCPFKDYAARSPHGGSMPYMGHAGMGMSPVRAMAPGGLFLPGASPMHMAAPYGASDGSGSAGPASSAAAASAAVATAAAASAAAASMMPLTLGATRVPLSPMLIHPQYAASRTGIQHRGADSDSEAGAGGVGRGAGTGTGAGTGATEDTSRLAALQLLSISKSAGVTPVDLSTDPLMRFMVRLSTNLGVPLATLDAVCRDEFGRALQAMPRESPTQQPEVDGGGGDALEGGRRQHHMSPRQTGANGHAGTNGGSMMTAAPAAKPGADNAGAEHGGRQPQLSATTVEFVRTLLMQKRLFVKDQNSGAEVALDGVSEVGGTLQFVFGTTLEEEDEEEGGGAVEDNLGSVANDVRGGHDQGEDDSAQPPVLAVAAPGHTNGHVQLDASPSTPKRTSKRGAHVGVEVVQPAKRSKAGSADTP